WMAPGERGGGRDTDPRHAHLTYWPATVQCPARLTVLGRVRFGGRATDATCVGAVYARGLDPTWCADPVGRRMRQPPIRSLRLAADAGGDGVPADGRVKIGRRGRTPAAVRRRFRWQASLRRP